MLQRCCPQFLLLESTPRMQIQAGHASALEAAPFSGCNALPGFGVRKVYLQCASKRDLEEKAVISWGDCDPWSSSLSIIFQTVCCVQPWNKDYQHQHHTFQTKDLEQIKTRCFIIIFLPGQSLSHYVVQSVQAQFGRWDKEQSPLHNCDQVFEQGVSGVGRMNHSNHSQWLFQAWWNQSTQCLQPSHCAQPALGRTVNKLLGGAAQKVAKQRARVSPYHAIYLKEHQVPRTCKTFRTQLMQPCLQQHRVHQHGQHICACFCSWTAQLQWRPHDSGSSGEKHVVHDWIFHSLLQQRRSGPVGLRLVWGEGSPLRNWLCGHPVTKSPSAGLQWQTAGLVQGQEHARSWVDLFHGTLLWLKFQAGKDL